MSRLFRKLNKKMKPYDFRAIASLWTVFRRAESCTITRSGIGAGANKRKGFSAIMVLVILGGVTIIIIFSLTFTTLVNLRIIQNDTYGLRAFAAAECGIERILAEWVVDPQPVAGLIYSDVEFTNTVSGTMGTYTVEVTDLGNDEWETNSIGKSNGVYRKISAKVEVVLGGPDEAFAKAVFSDGPMTLFSNSDIWGDIYINGQPAWNNGTLRATDAIGTHFTYNPTKEEAPYGALYYYYPEEDVWQIKTGETNDGDAHGFWLSSQEIKYNTSWLTPTLNLGGNLEDKKSNQYWNRKKNGNEYLMPQAAKEYNEYTGIAIKSTTGPFLFPQVGNGSLNNFVSYYSDIAPNSTQFDNLTIYEAGTENPILLNNGYNQDIIGATADGEGFPTQFIWEGTATRNNGTTYSGPLLFTEDFVLYVNGSVSLEGEIGRDSFTTITSGSIEVDSNDFPQENFNLIAYDDIMIKTNTAINGILYSNTLITLDANPEIHGSLIGRTLDFKGGSSSITFHKDKVLEVGKWLPGGSPSTINLISWNEVTP